MLLLWIVILKDAIGAEYKKWFIFNAMQINFKQKIFNNLEGNLNSNFNFGPLANIHFEDVKKLTVTEKFVFNGMLRHFRDVKEIGEKLPSLMGCKRVSNQGLI